MSDSTILYEMLPIVLLLADSDSVKVGEIRQAIEKLLRQHKDTAEAGK